ncbi:hypothetical protein EDF33_102245 [Curtobacterium sp. PhB146]|nr:hypothetical protein EDF33_102245 [Curtobacterium sp. PhB146]
MLGHRDNDERRWQVFLHAFLLRKYFTGDRVSLTNVMRAAQDCYVGDEVTADEWDAMLKNVQKIEGGFGTSFGGDDRVFSDEELMMSQLYGRFMHGDYDGWKTTQLARDKGSDTAVFHASRSRANRVLQLASWIKEEIASQRIDVSTAE